MRLDCQRLYRQLHLENRQCSKSQFPELVPHFLVRLCQEFHLQCGRILACFLGSPRRFCSELQYQRIVDVIDTVSEMHRSKARSEERRVGKECRSRWSTDGER